MDIHRRPIGIYRRVKLFLVGDENWTCQHLIVFIFTFISYALVHASRKTLSTVKPSLITEWTDNSTGEQPVFPDEHSAEQFLALLDGSFLVAYAVGLYLGGTLGDHYDPTKVLACGMWASAVTVFLFGILKWLPFHSPAFYALTWIACGLFQSVAWPTEISIMGSWFGHNSRGAVLGLWSSCASIGNIIGTLVSSHTIQLGYEYSFVANACSLFFGAFFIFFCLSPHPIEHGRDAVISDTNDAETPKAISIFRAWCLPGVLAYSLAYACLKLVNYSLFFWLPFYLHAHYEWEESVADAFSTWFDLGGIIAAVLIGIASDHFSSRTPILIFMLFLSMGSLFIYANSPNDVLVNSFLMALTGFFVGGPSNLISSAVATDLGEAGEIRGSARALSTVTGIIDGTGSIGAGIGQLLIPKIEASFGWIAVFYGFIVMMFWAILCLIPLLWKELISRSRPRYVHLHTGRSEDSSESYSDNISDSGIAKVEAAIGVRHRNSPDS